MQNNCVAQQRDKAYVISGHARGQIGKQAIKSADKCIKTLLDMQKPVGYHGFLLTLTCFTCPHSPYMSKYCVSTHIKYTSFSTFGELI